MALLISLLTSAGGPGSVAGTAGQITATNSGGITTLSLPAAVTFPGTVTLNADPVSALQAVTKQYADAIAAGLDFKNTCVAATTGALTVTYANGVAGVGATLTNATTQAAFSIDGQSPGVGARVLIKNQASTLQNGVYTVTVVGTGITNWVLTRSLDYDQPSEIAPGDLIPVSAGTVNVDTLWLETATVATVGTDAITFSQFSSLSAPYITWNDQTTTPVAAVAANGYSANNAGLVTINIPATVAFGTVFRVAGNGAGGWLVRFNTGQVANSSTGSTTSAGSLASTNRYDCIELLCVTANTTFTVTSSFGNITVA
jgi:hypothetical protein